MKSKIISFIIFFGLCSNSYCQISITETEKGIEKIEKKVLAPPYDSLENFIRYEDYYDYGSKNKCSENDYYSRYIGLQIYYPMYKDSFHISETLFLKSSNFESLNWSKVGNQNYTIIDIYPEFNKSTIYDKVIKNYAQISKWYLDYPLFLLKNNSGDTIYSLVDEIIPKFILSPYYIKLKQSVKDKYFVSKSDFSAFGYPDDNKFIFVEAGSSWKCVDAPLIRKKSLTQYENADEDTKQEIIMIYLLKRDTNTIILHHSIGIGDMISRFMLKEEYIKQNNTEQKTENIKRNNYIKMYGKEFGILIAQQKIKIGMTKKMCEESWGVTFDNQKITKKTEISEICHYRGRGTLVFINNILTKIIE